MSEEISKLEQANKDKDKDLKQSAKIVKAKERDLDIVNQEKQELKANLEKVFTEQQKLMDEKEKN